MCSMFVNVPQQTLSATHLYLAVRHIVSRRYAVLCTGDQPCHRLRQCHSGLGLLAPYVAVLLIRYTSPHYACMTYSNKNILPVSCSVAKPL